MDAARTGVRWTWIERASFECQNWDREKGALPGVKGRKGGKEWSREGALGDKIHPSLSKKEEGGGFGSTAVAVGPERVQH